MATFMIRVELHSATYPDYVQLAKALAAQNVIDTIKGDNGLWYKLPPAEYQCIANLTPEAVRQIVATAAATTGKTYAIVVTQSAGMSWSGLEAVKSTS
jgi:hypothetical protein